MVTRGAPGGESHDPVPRVGPRTPAGPRPLLACCSAHRLISGSVTPSAGCGGWQQASLFRTHGSPPARDRLGKGWFDTAASPEVIRRDRLARNRRDEPREVAKTHRPAGGILLGMSKSTTIKVSVRTRDALRELADREGLTFDAQIAKLVRRERRRIIGAQLASAPLDADDEAVLDASASDVAAASG